MTKLSCIPFFFFAAALQASEIQSLDGMNFPKTIEITADDIAHKNYEIIASKQYDANYYKSEPARPALSLLMLNADGDFIVSEFIDNEMSAQFSGHSGVYRPENKNSVLLDKNFDALLCPNGYFSARTKHRLENIKIYNKDIIFSGVETQSFTDPVNFHILHDSGIENP